MAVAAELVKQQQDEFDWDYAESQFDERPPEGEIYGRSLSTVHRLGTFAVGKSQVEIVQSPEAAQAKAEFNTSVEEGFGTDVELGGGLEVRDFDFRPVVEGKVMSSDLKTAVSDMTEAGLKCAVKTAAKDRLFRPQLTRSEWDHENAKLVDSMARGETSYNMRIVASPFPEEAAAVSGDDYWRDIGYVPSLRRGFIQFYYVSEGGVTSGSLSFDGSDKRRLRELFSKYGVEIPEEEITDNWLKYPITATLPEDEAKKMALEIADEAGDPKYKKDANTVEVTNEHRALLETVFNDSYIHACESLALGYQTRDARELILRLADKAHHFNEKYKDSLYKMRVNGEFTDSDFIAIHELLVYSTIEMMRALHLNKKGNSDAGIVFYDPNTISAEFLESLDPASFQTMLGGFGAEGAKNDRVYSACGLSISLGESDGAKENPQRAFGGKDCPEIKNGQTTKCPHCKKIVQAIVPAGDKSKIYCSNKKCKLAAPGLK
ncbi:MAG TPA: hypothetical protein VHA05_02135 [Candidatus Saccharimonadales bacterium]|nr:hypothetical protein [Candidatus Saccharimonadales bacterium]